MVIGFGLAGQNIARVLKARGTPYVAIDATFLLTYGASANWLASKLRDPAGQWMNRLAGSCLIGAAVLLGLKTVQRSR